jgi:hypothetical protein
VLFRTCGSEFTEVEQILVSGDQFQAFRDLQERRRWQWPAVFSANRRREIWPFGVNGLTPEEKQKGIRGLSRVVDQVADEFLRRERSGGRFWINDYGAFCKDEAGRREKFASFVMANHNSP